MSAQQGSLPLQCRVETTWRASALALLLILCLSGSLLSPKRQYLVKQANLLLEQAVAGMWLADVHDSCGV